MQSTANSLSINKENQIRKRPIRKKTKYIEEYRFQYIGLKNKIKFGNEQKREKERKKKNPCRIKRKNTQKNENRNESTKETPIATLNTKEQWIKPQSMPKIFKNLKRNFQFACCACECAFCCCGCYRYCCCYCMHIILYIWLIYQKHVRRTLLYVRI